MLVVAPEPQLMVPAKSVPPVSGWSHGIGTLVVPRVNVEPQGIGISPAPPALGGSDANNIVAMAPFPVTARASLKLLVPGSCMPKTQKEATLWKPDTLLNELLFGEDIDTMQIGSGPHDLVTAPDTLVVSPTSVNVIESAFADWVANTKQTSNKLASTVAFLNPMSFPPRTALFSTIAAYEINLLYVEVQSTYQPD